MSLVWLVVHLESLVFQLVIEIEEGHCSWLVIVDDLGSWEETCDEGCLVVEIQSSGLGGAFPAVGREDRSAEDGA